MFKKDIKDLKIFPKNIFANEQAKPTHVTT